ncbi:MAG: lipocalin family protein [Dysgonamonadaceae bacterium]|jgi:hypothetical protein|nr:lipocalin family protein [Dysgonamonadaceae bacterium]
MNTMKFLTTLLLITVCFGFVSCKDEDKDEVALNPLVGSWRLVDETYHKIKDDTIVVAHAELKGDSLNYNGEMKFHQEIITFNEDGTYQDVLVSEAFRDTTMYGMYILKDNQLYFKPENEEPSGHMVSELTDNSLALYIYGKYKYVCESGIDCDQSVYEEYDQTRYEKIR